MKLNEGQLRDIIVRINDMASGRYIQSDTVMRDRIAALTRQTVMEDDIMRGFLGYGGPEAERDILTGSGSLTEEKTK
jgi:hypothetical protein